MSYQLIETIELASPASTILFSNIPQDGTDLKLELSTRLDNNDQTFEMRINEDTSSLYRYSGVRQVTQSNPSTLVATGQSSSAILTTGSVALNDTYDCSHVYFFDYAQSGEKRMSVIASSIEVQGTHTHRYEGTAAITSLELVAFSNFEQYSTASLYKITAA